MAYDQNEGGRAIVHHRRGFPTAKERQTIFQVAAPFPACAGCEIVLKVVVVRSDFGERAHRRRTEGSPAKIGVEDNAGAVNN